MSDDTGRSTEIKSWAQCIKRLKVFYTVLMTENKAVNNPKIEECFDSYGKFFSLGPKFATQLISISFIAYIAGLARAYAYYSKFHAAWIVSQLKNSELLEFSIMPFVILSVPFFLITEAVYDDNINSDNITKFIYSSIAISITITFVNIIFVSKYFLVAELPLKIIAIFAWSCTFSLMVNLIFLSHLKNKNIHSSIIFSIVPFLCYAVLYFLPSNIGNIEGVRDSDLTRTLLPKIILKSTTTPNMRLLRYDGKSFFIVILPDKKQKNNELSIQVVSSTEIDKITRH